METFEIVGLALLAALLVGIGVAGGRKRRRREEINRLIRPTGPTRFDR